MQTELKQKIIWMEILDPWTRTIRLETHKLINFTFKLSNSYSKFILIINTQEQQTQNIQSQEQKNRNPKYSKICTQILPQKSIVHKHQPKSEWFFFFFFLSFFMFLSRADLGLEWIQWRRFWVWSRSGFGLKNSQYFSLPLLSFRLSQN